MDEVTIYKAVERQAILVEGELEELVSTSWSTVGRRVKSVKGTPKGGKGDKEGKKRDDSKGKPQKW